MRMGSSAPGSGFGAGAIMQQEGAHANVKHEGTAAALQQLPSLMASSGPAGHAADAAAAPMATQPLQLPPKKRFHVSSDTSSADQPHKRLHLSTPAVADAAEASAAAGGQELIAPLTIILSGSNLSHGLNIPIRLIRAKFGQLQQSLDVPLKVLVDGRPVGSCTGEPVVGVVHYGTQYYLRHGHKVGLLQYVGYRVTAMSSSRGQDITLHLAAPAAVAAAGGGAAAAVAAAAAGGGAAAAVAAAAGEGAMQQQQQQRRKRRRIEPAADDCGAEAAGGEAAGDVSQVATKVVLCATHFTGCGLHVRLPLVHSMFGQLQQPVDVPLRVLVDGQPADLPGNMTGKLGPTRIDKAASNTTYTAYYLKGLGQSATALRAFIGCHITAMSSSSGQDITLHLTAAAPPAAAAAGGPRSVEAQQRPRKCYRAETAVAAASAPGAGGCVRADSPASSSGGGSSSFMCDDDAAGDEDYVVSEPGPRRQQQEQQEQWWQQQEQQQALPQGDAEPLPAAAVGLVEAAARAAEASIPKESWKTHLCRVAHAGLGKRNLHELKVSSTMFKAAFPGTSIGGFKLLLSVYRDGQLVGGPQPCHMYPSTPTINPPKELMRQVLGCQPKMMKAAAPNYVQLHVTSVVGTQPGPAAAAQQADAMAGTVGRQLPGCSSQSQQATPVHAVDPDTAFTSSQYDTLCSQILVYKHLRKGRWHQVAGSDLEDCRPQPLMETQAAGSLATAAVPAAAAAAAVTAAVPAGAAAAAAPSYSKQKPLQLPPLPSLGPSSASMQHGQPRISIQIQPSAVLQHSAAPSAGDAGRESQGMGQEAAAAPVEGAAEAAAALQLCSSTPVPKQQPAAEQTGSGSLSSSASYVAIAGARAASLPSPIVAGWAGSASDRHGVAGMQHWGGRPAVPAAAAAAGHSSGAPETPGSASSLLMFQAMPVATAEAGAAVAGGAATAGAAWSAGASQQAQSAAAESCPFPPGYSLPEFSSIDAAHQALWQLLSTDYLHAEDEQVEQLDDAVQLLGSLADGGSKLGAFKFGYDRVKEWVVRRNMAKIRQAVARLLGAVKQQQ